MLPRSVLALVPAVLPALLLVASSSLAGAAQPVVDGILPTGVRRGETTKVTLSGARLQDARQVLWHSTGSEKSADGKMLIEVSELKPIDNKSVELTIVTAPELQPGLYPFRLVTATGISNLRFLSVGALPIVAETEPNSDFAAPQKIEVNSTVTGVITREDEDYFSVDLKAGQTLTCELEGTRLAYYPRNNSNFFDPFVAILDAGRFEQVASDDAALLQQDPLCSFKAPEDGTYTIVVRDSAFGGEDNFHYRLHVGDFPRPVAVIPAGGQPGQKIEATYVGVDGSSWKAPLELPANPSLEHPVSFTSETGIAPSPNLVRVLPMPVTVETEPNDNYREPMAIADPLPIAICGQIGSENDYDSFSFEAKKGQKIVTRVFARGMLRSPLDAVTDIFDPEGKRIAGNDDSGGPDALAEFTAAADGRYVIRLYDHLRGGGPEYAYRIEIEVAQPQLTLSLPEVRQDEPIDLPVPKGNRIAVMVNAARTNFGGDLDLAMLDLPPGITATTFTMPANRPTIPLLLSADPGADLAGALAALTAKPTSGTPEVTGGLKQRHKLIRGQNRVDVWGIDTDRVAVAVTEPSPVDLELVAPTVPIVRNGSAELKVVARRNDSYKNAIPVRLLYVPPGISTNNSRVIAAEQNEVTIPITANGSAAVGTWPMLVTAYVDIGNGAIQTATLPVELTVEDVFFNFSFTKAAAEQGATSQVIVGVEVAREFEGTAEVTLVGLPAGVTSPAATQPITKDTTEVVFPVEIAADARPGNHKTLVCQAIVHHPKGEIRQTVGTGELQVDKPLPAPAAKPAAKPTEPAKPAAAAPPKPLTRLEQLRAERANNQ
ncbi:PPC domain-containing protein [Candidatus Laterigemmans baculatus]|uniref:PPC domain-containing protein n=1 Tax=Candidatus Laterigemmans baculatus TaxID=2770505 RepID=UPI0013DB955C|nr:PPC domain-containing protein [Candidatus Laterigemmans baculatus]